jgi:hypothetical protein
MKAVNYQGAFKIKVEDVPKPAIEHPDDVIVKVTTAGKSERKKDRWRRCCCDCRPIPVPFWEQ